MTYIEVFTVIIALISLVISYITAVKANLATNNDLRLSRRAELHSLMQAIEQVLIDKPELVLMFKSEQDHSGQYNLPPLAVQEAYVFMHLNLFELAYSINLETSHLSANQNEISEAWDATIENFFINCIPACSIWQEYKALYYKSFRDHVDNILVKLNESL